MKDNKKWMEKVSYERNSKWMEKEKKKCMEKVSYVKKI